MFCLCFASSDVITQNLKSTLLCLLCLLFQIMNDYEYISLDIRRIFFNLLFPMLKANILKIHSWATSGGDSVH